MTYPKLLWNKKLDLTCLKLSYTSFMQFSLTPLFTFTFQDEEEAEEQAVEVKTEEESNVLSSQSISQAGDSVEEDEESDGEEEAIELEKKPDVEEVGWEKREEDEEVEVTERTGVEQAEEAVEGEDDGAEEMPEMFPDAQGEEVQAPVQEADEGVVLEDDTVHPVKHTSDDQIPTEMADQVLTTEQEHFNQNSGDETEEGEEIVEEGVDLNIVEQKSDQEEDVEASQRDADQSEQELKQESAEAALHSDTKQVEKDPNEATEQDVSFKPPPLSLPPHENQSEASEASTPSKTSTTTIHINLVSPSSEKATSLFHLPPAAADLSQSATEAPSDDIETTSVEEEADTVGEEEEKQPIQDEEATPPESVEEKLNQPPGSADQSKVRFTIAPAWQRSQSLNPPLSPPASASSSSAVEPPAGEDLEAAPEDAAMKAEPATSPKVELVLSPSRVRNAGSSNALVTPKISTTASTEGKRAKRGTL